MALDPVVNFFRSTIATLPVASGGTSIVLQTGDGNKLPNPAIDGAFNLTIYNADDQFVAPEIVRVTARSGDTLTVTRAQEGTSATNKTAGSTWNVELTPTAKTIQDIDSAKLDVAGGTMTGDLTIPDKIIHSGDTNTAIRFPANDTVSVETAGSERMRIASTGNVGIGTTAPTNKLHISTTSSTEGILISRNAANDAGLIDFSNTLGALARIQVVVNDLGSGANEGNLLFYTAFNASLSERMRISSAGNVGIGTTSPTGKLHVVGGKAIIAAADGATGNDWILNIDNDEATAGSNFGLIMTAGSNSSDSTMLLRSSSNTAILRVRGDGNVGIGTESPATKLDVSGSIRASTGILFGTDTAAANTLDDYEQGTFTMTMAPSAGFTPTSNTVTARYTKIGNVVVVVAKPVMSVPASLGTYVNNSTSFSILLSGLPFNIASNIQDRSVPVIGIATNLGATSGYLTGAGVQNTDQIAIHVNKDDGSLRTSPNLTVSTTVDLHIQFTYRTA